MEKEKNNRRLDINFDKLLGKKDDGPPPELVLVPRTNNEYQLSSNPPRDNPERMSDHDLSQAIIRVRHQINSIAPKLPDRGAKFKANLKRMEEEQNRRNSIRVQKIDLEGEKPVHSQGSHSSGACNGFKSGAPSHTQSSFTSLLSEKLDKKPDCSTRTTNNAFDKEISYLTPGGRQTMSAKMLNKDRKGAGMSSRQSPFKCPGSHSNKDRSNHSNGVQKHIPSSTFYFPNPDVNVPSHLSKRRRASQVQTALNSRSRKGETVVLLDEEDQPAKTTQQEDEPLGLLKEAKIYYPSRDDPESVEICYADTECLAPEGFLSSTIMNFYIRYLQRPVSATGRSRGDYHFFNTYFYEKLKEAVSYKRSDKDAFFVKFRRWWKGVNIFEKAYILLPIHESLHWSLVIICIPDKEDESGPVVLHLDSLGYHDSKQIFHHIKSYLIEEWNYLNQGDLPDFPIADRIWKHLRRRISDDIITVPQQKNDYDCGIFVLYFMERFIEEAPERLKKKDSAAMFGRQWFKPEEASRLRGRIKELLLEEFQNPRIESDIRESSPSSSDDTSVGCSGNTSVGCTE